MGKVIFSAGLNLGFYIESLLSRVKKTVNIWNRIILRFTASPYLKKIP
jgi:hypothetical protein